MRKIRICLCFVFLVSLLSCSKFKETSLRFDMEKAFSRAEKQSQTLMVNPQAAQTQDYKRAIDAYRKVIDMLPSTTADTPERKGASLLAGLSQLRIADIHLLQNNPSLAMVELEKVLSHYPDNPEQTSLALFKMAQIHLQMGNLTKAVENYHLLLNLDKYPPVIAGSKPNFDLLAVPLNLILVSKDRNGVELEFENAENYYLKVIQNYPNSPLSLAAKFNLAKTYQMRGDWKASIGILETIEDSSGQIPSSVLMQVGDIYLSASDTGSARLVFERVISTYPTDSMAAQAMLKIAYIYYQQTNYSKAREALLGISKQFPKQGRIVAQAQYLMAQSYEKEGEWDRAVNEFEWLSTNFPSTVQGMEVPLHIADYYQKLGNPKIAQTYFDKAIQRYQKLIKEYPKTQTELLALKYTARCYALQNRWEESITALRKVVDGYPRTSDAFDALLTCATILEQKLNQKKEAKEIYSQILSGFPKHPSTPQIRAKMESL